MKTIFSRLISLCVVMAVAFTVVMPCAPKAAAVDTAGYANLSSYIVETHPRLYVTSFDGLKEKYLSNSVTKRWYEELIRQADAVTEVMEYDSAALELKRGNVRVIDSQAVLERFYCLAFAAAAEKSEAYAAKLWHEIEAAISLPHWNPWHWLEVAEMMHAMAISYDWCYNFWNNDQKQAIANAIVDLGLTPAIIEYDGSPQWNEWMKGLNGTEIGTNWAIVCNTGVLMGALSVYENEPELCNTMINNAIRSIKAGTNAYSENGAYRETLNYWNYATSNLIMATDAFESAIGGNFNALPPIAEPFTYDFSKAPGISVTCDFPIYANGPAGVFNYGDNTGGALTSSPAFMWLGNRFDNPHYTEYHLDNLEKKGLGDENLPLDLLWYDGGERKKTLAQDRVFEEHFASMRSSWDSDKALYVTLKGGTNGRPHQHYDLGTFVLDAYGTRFARQLGAVSYDRKETREYYYKGRTEGQNTVVINPDESCGQYTSGTSEFESFYSGSESAYAILDMTDAYDKAAKSSGVEYITVPTQVTSARRGVKMYSDKTRIVVQDEFKMDEPSEYYWFMHTLADIELRNNNKSAVLTLNGKSVFVNVLSNQDASFEVMQAEPLFTSPYPDDQKPRTDKKLVIHLENVTDAVVAVEFIPTGGVEPVYSRYITPLDDWHPENDIIRSGRELVIYGDDKPGRPATMLVKSPLGYIYGIDQRTVNEKGEYVFECTLPQNYENGIYIVYINGELYKTFEVTDGVDAPIPPVSYTISYELPEGISSSVLIAAEYKNGCMIQCASAAYSTTSLSATASFGFNPSKGSTLKFFCLENMENIIPLYPAKELKVE